MPQPIRVIHFADVHIGMENYGRLDPATGTSSRVRDFLARLDEVIEYALESQADLAVFAGDAFKNRDPEPTQQREFAQRIKRLADAMPTLLLLGNHDMPAVAAKASSVDIFRALQVPGVIVGHRPEGRVVETRHGPLFLAWMPYPMRNRLLLHDEHRGKSIPDLEAALLEATSLLLRDLAEQAEPQPMPRLLAGHFTVAGAVLGSERSVMLGRDAAVLRSLLADPVWDYVALGHIHKHQDLNAGLHPPVVYSGSLERIDFGEEAEPKGFCEVLLERGRADWRFIEVQARRFVTVRVDARQAPDPTAAALEALEPLSAEGAVVRVLVQLRAEQQAGLRERELQGRLAGAASLSVGREIESESRARLGDLAPESLAPLELVRRYFEARGQPAERLQALLARAEDLLRDPG